MARDNSRGNSGATNGPYHWGNPPQPRRRGSGCPLTALALLSALAAVATGAVELARHVI